ncbi:hypothetical protein ACWGR4_28375 [Embleya sp. NPDC055664]
MLTAIANRDSRLTLWLRVREFAVPPSMIETATTRRLAGDWQAACAAAGVDVDIDLRFEARTRGGEFAARIRDDLRGLAPDLLRWHMPRIAPDGLLRPGLTVSLARYDVGEHGGTRPVHLVARTPPAWADAGQRIALALWDGSHRDAAGFRHHPHRHPHRRFRLDLHRHLWDARRSDELWIRSGADRPPCDGSSGPDPAWPGPIPAECAVDRWAAEAAILLRAAGRPTGTGAVAVRCGGRRRLVLHVVADDDGPGPSTVRLAAVEPRPAGGDITGLPVLPDAATWIPPDLELLRAGLIEPDRLHPLVAAALIRGHVPGTAPVLADHASGRPDIVECRGSRHRIGLVDGVLAPLDHDPAEIRREELLHALTGTPLPCLQAIDAAHRRPDCIAGVRERLDHGDIAGALAVVESLLGPDALPRGGLLRDELEDAAERLITHGLFRAGLGGPAPDRIPLPNRPRPPHTRRAHPRNMNPH